MKNVILAGTLAPASLAPAVLEAQNPEGAPLDSAMVTWLRPSRLVRFAGPGMGRVEGTVERQQGNSLSLTNRGVRRVISLGSIDTLWVRGRATKTGAIIGGILGIGTGVFLAALADGLCEFDCHHNSTFRARFWDWWCEDQVAR